MSSYMSLYDEGKKKLMNASVRSSDVDARNLLLDTFGIDMNELLKNYTVSLDDERAETVKKYFEVIERRAGHEPVQYIIHSQYFCGLDIYVDKRVLIPRLDTEVLVETVLGENISEGKDSEQVLDMCTGSGCIAIALKKLGKYTHVTGTDISEQALEVAKKNAKKHGADISFITGNMFDSLDGDKCYDIITCNPPYIRSQVIDSLDPEVKNAEPRTAIDGGEDGLKYYRILSKGLNKYLKKNGRCYLEIGFDQAEEVGDLLRSEGLDDIRVKKDLAGLDRIICAVKG